tara:strand:+ start:12667 stop:12789 length:123 start_codon:yes stop_codon:yes gene_type:complete
MKAYFMVDIARIELATSRLSGERSNRLSYISKFSGADSRT